MQIRSASNTNEVNWDDPLNKGLVAWYPFKQKGGNVLRDVVGNYDGTLDSSMTSDDWVASPETNSLALDFDGSDDDVATGVSSEGWTQLSLFCWVWAEAGVQADSYASFLFNQVENIGFFQDASINRFLVRVDTDTGSTAVDFNNEDFCTGEWRHVGLTWDGASLRPHLNGQWTGFSGARTGTIDGAGQYIIGSQTGGANFWNGKVSDVRIYDRGLSESEVRDLYQASRTGYVDQFKRRSFPVGVTPTPTESHPSNGLIRLKQNAQPSYKAGYAKSASESASPELWDGLRGAWVPQMGITGIERVFDVAGRNHGVIADSEADDIKPNYLHLDADGGGTFGEYMRADQQQMTLPFTLTSRARLTDPTIGMVFFSAYKQGSDSGRDYHNVSGSTDGKIGIQSRDQLAYDSDVSVSGLFEVGEWVNVTAVFKEGRHDAYLNGRHVAGGTVAAGLTADMILVGTLRLNFSAVRGTGDFSSVLYHDRELSLSEIQELNADPLAPFRQRRYFPVSLQTEEPPVETATSGLIRLKSPKQTQPSYKAGYAKSANESANPELWDGLRGAWVPNLGDTGRTLKDVTDRAEDGYDTNNLLTRVMTKSGPATYMNANSSTSFYSLGSVDVGITTQATWVYDAEILSYASSGILWEWDLSGPYKTWAQLSGSGEKVRWGLTTDNGRVLLDTTSAVGTGDKILVFRWDGSEMTTWVNGAKAATGSHSGLLANPTSNHRIGAGSRAAAHTYFRSLLVYNRAISDDEIQGLYADPLAPFRQRRYFPVSLPTEEPPTETASTGLIRLKSPKQSEPSYKAGYAKSASESAFPELWDGLHRAWVPSLGATNDLIDVASNSNATLNSPSARPIWNPTSVQTTGNGDATRFNVPSIGYTGIATIYIRVKINSDTGEVARLFEFDTDNYLYVTSALSAKIGGTSLASYTYPVGEWLDLFIQPVGTDILFFINDDTNHSTSNRTWNTLSSGALLNAESSTSRAPDCELESVCFWKRQLSQNEMRSIRTDPLAPFRQRRYAPVSLPTEEPPITFNHWYARPGRTNRIVGSGVHV